MLILDTDVLTIIQRRRGIEYTRLVRRLNQVDDEVAVVMSVRKGTSVRGE